MTIHRHYAIPFISFLICGTLFSTSLAQEKLPEIIKRIKPSTVVILTYDEAGRTMSQGSGFFVSQTGDVITNRHVVQGAYRAEIKTSDGKVYPIKKIVAEDREGDLVRVSVEISPKGVHPLSVSASVPEEGEQVLVIGNPLGLEQTVSNGIVAAVREIPEVGMIIQITAPISAGSSGSPVVNMNGEVIGVATFVVIEGQNLNFAIPGERITKLIPGKGKSVTEWGRGGAEEWLVSAEGLHFTGLIALWTEDCQKALPYFEQAVLKNPRYAEAYFRIGYCKDELGRFQEAIESLKQAIRIKPDLAEAHANLGVVYGNLGRNQEAIESLKLAVRLRPDLADAIANLGVAYGRLGRYTEAIESYKNALRIRPDYAYAYTNLGIAYDNLGRYPEAIESYQQALRTKPLDAETYFNLGFTYANLGRHQESIEAFKQALRIKPDLDWAHYALGVTYLILGDRGAALDEYKALKAMNSTLANELFNLMYE